MRKNEAPTEKLLETPTFLGNRRSLFFGPVGEAGGADPAGDLLARNRPTGLCSAGHGRIKIFRLWDFLPDR